MRKLSQKNLVFLNEFSTRLRIYLNIEENNQELNRSNKILQEIAHFLCVNSGDIPTIGFDGKIPMLYFLFSYGKRFEKQCYTDFAFDIMQECLSDALIKLQSTEEEMVDFDLTSLELGWSIQKFNGMSFFETDEMNEILVPFDDIAIRCLQVLITNAPSEDTIDEFLFLITYMKDREHFFKTDSSQGLFVTEYLAKTIDSVEKFLRSSGKENIKALGLFKLLHYQKFKTTKAFDLIIKEEIIQKFENAMNRGDLDMSLFFYQCFSDIIKIREPEKSIFWDKLIESSRAKIKSMYKNPQNYPLRELLNVQRYGSALLKNQGFIHREFLGNIALKNTLDNYR